MLDKRGIDRAQLVVYVQVAMDASGKIFELHYNRRWSAKTVHGISYGLIPIGTVALGILLRILKPDRWRTRLTSLKAL